MIVGNGDIASVLEDKEGLTYFASGVSNSSETREEEFEREKELLKKQDKSKHLVYFSSLCIFYSDSPYAEHKKLMEFYVSIWFKKYTIIRLGNITWGKNPNTLLNFFRNRIKNNEPFEIQDTFRYLVDKEEFLYWINMIPSWNCEMNITGQRLKVQTIVNRIKMGTL